MSQFDVEKFMSEPNEDTFRSLNRGELIALAKHLKLEVKTAMKKREVQIIIVKYLVSEGVFGKTVLEEYETPKSKLSPDQQFEIQKIKMDREREREERERQERLEDKERQERLEEKRLQHEYEMKKLELQAKLGSDPSVEKSSASLMLLSILSLCHHFSRQMLINISCILKK